MTWARHWILSRTRGRSWKAYFGRGGKRYLATVRFFVLASAALSLTLTGCRSRAAGKKKGEPHKAEFRALYGRLEAAKEAEVEIVEPPQLLTISTSGMPLKTFLRWLTDKSDISIICDQSLDETPVTIDVKDVPLPDVLSAVSRRMSVDLTQQGNLYYVGSLKPEDRGVLVRKVRRLSADDLNKTVQVLLTEMGRAAAYSDGLLVVGDRVRVLQRINAMLDQVESSEANTWVIQLYLISIQDTLSRELGVETTTALDIAATFATSGGGKTVAKGAFRAF